MKRYFLVFALTAFNATAQTVTVYDDAVNQLSQTPKPLILKQPEKKTPAPKKNTPEKISKICALQSLSAPVPEDCLNKIGKKHNITVVLEIPENENTPQNKRNLLKEMETLKQEIVKATSLKPEQVFTVIIPVKENQSLYITEESPKAGF